MVLGIQIVAVSLGLFLLYYTYMLRKRGELNQGETVFWLIGWLVFIGFSLIPNSVDFIVEKLQVSRTIDFFTVLGFLFLIVFTFYNYAMTRKLEKKLTRLVQKIAQK